VAGWELAGAKATKTISRQQGDNMTQVYVTPSWLNDSDLDVYAYRIYGFLADKAALEPLVQAGRDTHS